MGLRLVFMGTPDFAVPTLERLHADGREVVAVVTPPDRPAGRGLRLQPCPVKTAALRLHLPVLQPADLKDEEFINTLRKLHPDLGIVVAFRKLPRTVWSLPRLGTINLHASLLPDYRGAAPIQRALMAGERTTGLTTFFINDELDTGHIVLQQAVPIEDNETGGSLHDRLKVLGADLVAQTVDRIAAGDVHPLPQPAAGSPKKAPKIRPADRILDFQKPVHQLYNQVRALSPVPAAYLQLNGEPIKILMAEPVFTNPEMPPGTPCTDETGRLLLACADGFLAPTLLQRPGRNPLRYDDFLNGWPQAKTWKKISLHKQ
ncbi:MAG: methionyl-tRNA formyltransferase [Chitinophagales bacterium]|nr:methionyl-tRNA formyltransferase [Chitinophagales bacterium]MDW8393005.1 methionyl-tRNA formyltransferase [Chitinophagales bacterium]